MLDLLSVGTLDNVGTLFGAAASTLVDGLVSDTARIAGSNVMSFNATLLLVGFVLGLCSEMRGRAGEP
jgi:hypothetical protein